MDQQQPEFGSQPPTANDLGLSADWDRLLPLYNSRPGNHREAQVIPSSQPVVQQDASSVPKPHPSPLFSPPLEQVPEEPEGFNSPRESNDFGRNASLRHAKSSPNMSRSGSSTKLFNQAPSIPKMPDLPLAKADRPVSQGSDTLGDLTRRSFVIQIGDDGTVTRPKNRDTNVSWEDDVDFCYKHSAEADCEFDWNNVSRLLDAESSDDEEFVSSFAKNPKLMKQLSGSTDSSEEIEIFHDRSFFHQSILSGTEGLPELDYHSVHTGSSNSLALATPHAISTSDAFKMKKLDENHDFTSPYLPPLDLRGDLDSDQLYADLMVGFNFKEAQQQYLPILEPKAYSPVVPQKSQRNSPQIGTNAPPTLMQRRFSNDRSKIPMPPAPTSAPHTSPPHALVRSMSKDLPPLPPASPRPIHTSPTALRVENMVAQLRSPEESPTETNMPPFTPPSSTKPSPVPDQNQNKLLVRRRPTRLTENPVVKIQELSREALSRNASEDTVVTTIFLPSTPPQSPDHKATLTPLLAPTSHPSSNEHVPKRTASQTVLKHSPSLPLLRQQEPKRAASDSELNSQSGSPLGKSPTSPKLSYSLFPPQPRPGRPRRLTAA
jgi:hypothetical protein